MRRIKPFVAIFSHTGAVEIFTMADLFALFRKTWEKGNSLGLITAGAGGTVAERRIQAVKACQEKQGTHLLFVDQDMRFPSSTLEDLFKHNLPLVSVNYKQRHANKWVTGKNGQEVSSVGKTGLEQVGSSGLGLTLMEMRIFDTLPEPWFFMPWVPALNRFSGEDAWFYGLVRRHHGVHLYVDHDLSQKVRHVGQAEYGATENLYGTTGAKVVDPFSIGGEYLLEDSDKWGDEDHLFSLDTTQEKE